MADSKKTLTWIFVIAAFAILLLLIYVFRCKLFNLASCVQDPNKTKTPVPSGSPTSKWIPETFPLNIGMFGPKIKAMQTALGIAADGKFGSQTNGAIISAGYTVPLSQSDYNAIVNPQSTTVNPVGKSAYANKDGVTVYNVPDFSVYRVFSKDEWIGKIVSVSNNQYYTSDGKAVATAYVYLQ